MPPPTGAENKTPGQAAAPSASDAIVNEPEAPATPEFIRLPSGTVLTETQALALASDRSMRIIVLAGTVGCGKTTLITSLYEFFQSGPIKNVQFAGCDTFTAFEQRCHLSRTESGKESADTLRTGFEDLNPEYLHLKIQNGESETDHIDFLFTDVSGEVFEHARNSTDDCKQLTFLRRASHFVAFLDCERALITEKKWGMVQEIKSLFQSCLDSSMLENTCFVTVVWSKCDFFAAAKDKLAVDAFVKEVEDDLKTSFGDRIPNLKFHRTAARPTRFPNLKMGYGVRDLLADWITIWPQGRPMQLEPPVENDGKRESEQFAKRHYGHGGNT